MSETVIEPGTLYLVGTPIGNLGDMTPRAVEVLNAVDLIACEDTRTSGNLFKHFDISGPATSFHQHNEHHKTPGLIQRLQGGGSIALISDAGMPAISDPGFLLVRAAHQAGITVVVIPGPAAAINALASSGLPSDRFVFEGFLPQKKGRKTRIESLREEQRTMIFYESPYRVVRLLGELKDVLSDDRLAAVCRELTKKFEEIRRGPLLELHEDFSARKNLKGEFVLIVAGKDYAEDVA